MSNLLEEHYPTGRPKKISVEQAAIIQNELRDKEGFRSYKEVHLWLRIIQGISSSYMTVYRLVRYELQAKLKVARPKNKKQENNCIEEFKANLSGRLRALLEKNSGLIKKASKVSFWCSDESRFGLHTVSNQKINIKRSKANRDRPI